MDDLIRRIVESHAVWAAREGIVDQSPPDLDSDYAARVIALLVERLGGVVDIEARDIVDVPRRLLLVPYTTEPAMSDQPGLRLETRRLMG
jgi:hypothetical protein